MMRKIAIGLAVATIAMGGSTLTASALQQGHMKSGISKGAANRPVSSHRFGPRTYGYAPDYERTGRYEPGRHERLGRLYEREKYGERRLGRYERERLERLGRLYEREKYGERQPGRYERLGRMYERERFGGYQPGRYERLGRYERGERYGERYRYERPYGYRHGGQRYGYRKQQEYYGRR